MRKLADHVRELIALEGPITVERYMSLCLQHYYATRDPLGSPATSPPRPRSARCSGS